MLRKLIIAGLVMMFTGAAFTFGLERTFDDYVVLLKVFGSIQLGNLNGPIMDEERDSWTLKVTYSDGSTKTGTPDPRTLFWGLNAEILWNHFGFVLVYNPIQITEMVSVGDGKNYEKKSYSGDLIKGSGFYGGVNYHLPFSFNEAVWSVYLGVKGGFITGDLSPYPSALNFLGATGRTFQLTGYSICPNIGINLMAGFFLLGVSFSYYIDNYTAGESLKKVYKNIDKEIAVNYFTLDFSVGLAF